MEMIDVLKKLSEISNKSPEVEKAITSTEAMNPKQQAAIAISKKEKGDQELLTRIKNSAAQANIDQFIEAGIINK